MLNEGYTLYKSLERCGTVLTKRHPDIKKLGKKNGLIVGINSKGKVASVEYRNSNDMAKLWTIRDGVKNSFPGMTLSMGLLNIDALVENTITSIIITRDNDERKLLLDQYQLNKAININDFDNNDAKKEKRIKDKIYETVGECNNTLILKNIWQKYGLNKKIIIKNKKETIKPMIADWKSVLEKLKERKEAVVNLGEEAKAYKILLDRMLQNNYSDSDRTIATEITELIFENIEKCIPFDAEMTLIAA
jgi:hypothetical protein